MRESMKNLLYLVLITAVWMGCEKQSLELMDTPAEVKKETSYDGTTNNDDANMVATAAKKGENNGQGKGADGDPPGKSNVDGGEIYVATIGSLNGSGVSGTVQLELLGEQLTVTINASGLEPGTTPHQSIRGLSTGGSAYCPDMRDDANGDGFIDMYEGNQTFGSQRVHLDPYPTVDANGVIFYKQIIRLGQNGNVSSSDLSPITKFNVVMCGMTRNGVYDQFAPMACGPISK